MWADAHTARRCLRYAQTCFAAAREWNERERRTRATSSSQEHIPAQVVRRVAAAEGCVCVGREFARAMSKTAGLAILCFFFQMYPKTLANTYLQTPDTYLLQSFQKQHL